MPLFGWQEISKPALIWKISRLSWMTFKNSLFFDISFLIDDEKAGAQMDVQEQAPFQIPAKKPSKAPKKQLKITSLFK